MNEITIGSDEKFTLTMNPKDASGDPAPVDGVPGWQVISGDSVGITTIQPSGLTAEITATGTLGDSIVEATADVQIGEGVRQVKEQFQIKVVEPMAESLDLEASDPWKQ